MTNINSPTTPKINEPKNQEIQERLLRLLLIGVSIIGFINLISLGTPFFRNGQYGLVIAISGIYLGILTITIFNRIPYKIRAYGLIGLIFVLAIISIQSEGMNANTILRFVFIPFLAVYFFNMRVGFITITLTTIAYFIAGFLTLRGLIPNPLNWTFQQWISSGIAFNIQNIIISFAIGAMNNEFSTLIQKLESSVFSEQLLTEQVKQEQAQLKIQAEDLERRLTQIRTAADVSRSLGTILEPEELMQFVANSLKDNFELYYVGIFLNDERNHFSNLVAGTGEAGQRMLAINHKLTIGGSSMVGWATAHKKPRVALDVGIEAIRFRNPHLPLTRSELALPLSVGNQNIGAISIQSTEPEAFDDDDITILQGIADSLAIALENARLFSQIESSLNEIQQLNQAYVNRSWSDIIQGQDQVSYTVEHDFTANDEEQPINIPMTLRDNQIIGNITLDGLSTQWSDEDKDFVDAVSNQAALALESARLLDESQRRVQREQALNTLTSKFAQTLDFEALMETVVRELGQLPNVRDASIHLASPSNVTADEVPPDAIEQFESEEDTSPPADNQKNGGAE